MQESFTIEFQVKHFNCKVKYKVYLENNFKMYNNLSKVGISKLFNNIYRILLAQLTKRLDAILFYFSQQTFAGF